MFCTIILFLTVIARYEWRFLNYSFTRNLWLWNFFKYQNLCFHIFVIAIALHCELHNGVCVCVFRSSQDDYNPKPASQKHLSHSLVELLNQVSTQSQGSPPARLNRVLPGLFKTGCCTLLKFIVPLLNFLFQWSNIGALCLKVEKIKLTTVS